MPLLTADIFDRRRNNPERLLRTRNQPASNSRIIPTAAPTPMPALAPALSPLFPDVAAGPGEIEASVEFGVGTPVRDDSGDDDVAVADADVVEAFGVGAGGPGGPGAREVTSSSSSSSLSVVVGSGTVGSVDVAIVSLIERVEQGRGCQSVVQQQIVYQLPIVYKFGDTLETRSRFLKQEYLTPPPHIYQCLRIAHVKDDIPAHGSGFKHRRCRGTYRSFELGIIRASCRRLSLLLSHILGQLSTWPYLLQASVCHSFC